MKRNSGDSGCSSGTRGVMGGGYTGNNSPANPQNVSDDVEIQTLGNALDFGDLAYERYGHGACSSPTRGLFGGGGESPAGAQKDITFITIASKGNSVQFGNLTKRRMYHGSSGNSVLTFKTNGGNRWTIDSDGHIIPGAAATYDIGSTSAEIGNVYIADSKNIFFGSDQDAEIYHNGSSGFYLNNSTGNFYIRSGGGQILMRPSNSYDAIVAKTNEVELYYNQQNH